MGRRRFSYRTPRPQDSGITEAAQGAPELDGAAGSKGWELGQHSPWLRCAHQASLPTHCLGSHLASSLACLAKGLRYDLGSRREEWGV